MAFVIVQKLNDNGGPIAFTFFDGHHSVVPLPPHLNAGDCGPLVQVRVESLPGTLIRERYGEIIVVRQSLQLFNQQRNS